MAIVQLLPQLLTTPCKDTYWHNISKSLEKERQICI
jgi:hypothetical protein